jgi:kumamolisin
MMQAPGRSCSLRLAQRAAGPANGRYAAGQGASPPTPIQDIEMNKPSKSKSYLRLRDRAHDTGAPWTVPALCAAYNWPSRLVGGGKIGIVELDGGWVRADMEAFFQSIGQPMPSITDVSVNGVANNPNQHLGAQDDPDYEVALDIQVAAAAYYVATGKPATIRVYWADDIAPGVAQASNDGCDVFSISWGGSESAWRKFGQQVGRDFIQEMEDAAQAATAAGMAIFAASGDNDSGDSARGTANVDVPSSCPHVVGCGGTKKTASSETVWNDTPGNAHGEGTGGGYSRYFPMQSFQSGAPHGPGRLVPDVAGNADQPTGYRIIVHGAEATVGGTSAVAPLYAGLFAAFGTKLGFVGPLLWDNHLCFNDISVGDNGHYRARIGPDACTGLGSPIGSKLAELFGAQTVPAMAPSSEAAPALRSRSYIHRGS